MQHSQGVVSYLGKRQGILLHFLGTFRYSKERKFK